MQRNSNTDRLYRAMISATLMEAAVGLGVLWWQEPAFSAKSMALNLPMTVCLIAAFYIAGWCHE